MAGLGSLIDNTPGESPNMPAEDGAGRGGGLAPPSTEDNNTDPVDPANPSFAKAKLVEVGGVLMDEQGNTWQVPGGNVEDLDDLYAGDVYKLPRGYTGDINYKPKAGEIPAESMFFVQIVPIARHREFLTRGFALMKLTELGIPEELANTSGSPLDSYHVVGDTVMVKIPLLIARRLHERKIKEVKERLKEVEPTQEMMRKAQLDGVMTRFERKTDASLVDPSKRTPYFSEEVK